MTEAQQPPAAGASRLVAALSCLGAVVLLGAVGASLRSTPTADLDTLATHVSAGTVVVDATGPHPLHDGDRVGRGSVVRTGTGPAWLETGGRSVQLAGATSVTVLDGARQRVDAGSVLVDALDGRGLRVSARTADVGVARGALVRLDTDGLLRVAAYRGSASVGSSGRRSEAVVARLHQVQVPAGARPGRVTPLALTPRDAWERLLLGTLVADDEQLHGLAEDLSAPPDGSAVAVALRAAVRPADIPAAERGERALSFALAHRGGGYSAEVEQAVLQGRALGGSWSVVAALAGTSAGDAVQWLSGLMGREQPVSAAGRPAGTAVAQVVGLPGVPAVPAGDAAVPAAPPARRAAPGPAPAPRPAAPVFSPTPLPEPLGGLVDAVRRLLPVTPPVTAPTGPLPAGAPLPAAAVPLPVLPLPVPPLPVLPAPASPHGGEADPEAPVAPMRMPVPTPGLPVPSLSAGSAPEADPGAAVTVPAPTAALVPTPSASS